MGGEAKQGRGHGIVPNEYSACLRCNLLKLHKHIFTRPTCQFSVAKLLRTQPPPPRLLGHAYATHPPFRSRNGCEIEKDNGLRKLVIPLSIASQIFSVARVATLALGAIRAYPAVCRPWPRHASCSIFRSHQISSHTIQDSVLAPRSSAAVQQSI